MTRLLIFAAALALAGCGSTRTAEPEIRIQRVEVPVTVDCVPGDLRGPPAYPDGDAALRQAPSAAERYRLIAAGRLLRIARLAELEGVVKACR